VRGSKGGSMRNRARKIIPKVEPIQDLFLIESTSAGFIQITCGISLLFYAARGRKAN
jgi:hypothetical protein